MFVEVIVYNDGINNKFGVDLGDINLYRRKSERGGKMHHKFCVIDNQLVITGSYNWSTSAECKNIENMVLPFLSLVAITLIQF